MHLYFYYHSTENSVNTITSYIEDYYYTLRLGVLLSNK